MTEQEFKKKLDKIMAEMTDKVNTAMLKCCKEMVSVSLEHLSDGEDAPLPG